MIVTNKWMDRQTDRHLSTGNAVLMHSITRTKTKTNIKTQIFAHKIPSKTKQSF